MLFTGTAIFSLYNLFCVLLPVFDFLSSPGFFSMGVLSSSAVFPMPVLLEGIGLFVVVFLGDYLCIRWCFRAHRCFLNFLLQSNGIVGNLFLEHSILSLLPLLPLLLGSFATVACRFRSTCYLELG